jgi:hypothetical protein
VISGVPIVEIKSLSHSRHAKDLKSITSKAFLAFFPLLPDALGKGIS